MKVSSKKQIKVSLLNKVGTLCYYSSSRLSGFVEKCSNGYCTYDIVEGVKSVPRVYSSLKELKYHLIINHF